MKNEELVQMAKEVKKNSYSPYSHFRVGAALLTKGGKVYTGVNVENASFGGTNCAERTAIFKAVSEGEHEFEKIAISIDSDNMGYPCAICLQVMSEFCDDDFKILVSNKEGEFKEVTLKDLLPQAFRKKDLDDFVK